VAMGSSQGGTGGNSQDDQDEMDFQDDDQERTTLEPINSMTAVAAA
jgi:hypothetical protein